jgi:CYTH domain-containing protein
VKGKRLRRQHFAVSRKERKVRVRVPRGRKTLQLRLKLKTGKRASVRKLSVRRR